MLVANARRVNYVDGKVTFRDGYRDNQASANILEASATAHYAGIRIPRFDFDYRDPGVYADITRMWLYRGRSAVITAENCELGLKENP